LVYLIYKNIEKIKKLLKNILKKKEKMENLKHKEGFTSETS